MLSLNFGEKISSIDSKGNIRIVPRFYLHVIQPWRFVKNNKIILSTLDIYAPYSNDVSDDWQFDKFNRPKEESSIFDAVKDDFNEEMTNSIIIDCEISTFGDIKIKFSNGVIFECFINVSEMGQNDSKYMVWVWRDFQENECIFYEDYGVKNE